ncbi:hypothetical protein [Streptomyces lunalinharesii]|uniref:Transposase n=1 Tax=Streptomyces lunalinharesii TaxID=333384 RepID=A0ABN3RR93_9ACTN
MKWIGGYVFVEGMFSDEDDSCGLSHHAVVTVRRRRTAGGTGATV